MTVVRALTDSGTAAFEDYLERLVDDPGAPTPRELLHDENTSTALPSAPDLTERPFTSRLDLGRHLHGVFEAAGCRVSGSDGGVWNWLSLSLFDQLCPPGEGGVRRPLKPYRYIISKDYRHYYRHMVAGAVQLYQGLGDLSRVVLYSPVNEFPDFAEQLASRQEFITNRTIIEVADDLYFDAAKGAPVVGAATRAKPGRLRRFISVIQQLDVTYDLYNLSRESLMQLLPVEFHRFRERRAG